MILSDKIVEGFLINCFFGECHFSLNNGTLVNKAVFENVRVGNTACLCVLGFVEDPPFIRKAYKWKGKITREERKPYLAFFAIKWIWV